MEQTNSEIESIGKAHVMDEKKKPIISTIIGEHHDQNNHYIAERMVGHYPSGRYRLKTVSYRFFSSEEELLSYCSKHEIIIARSHKDPKEGRIAKPHQGTNEGRIATETTKLPPECKAFCISYKEYRFCNEYIRCHNATRAYMLANPQTKSANSAGVCANYTLKKTSVKAYLASIDGK